SPPHLGGVPPDWTVGLAPGAAGHQLVACRQMVGEASGLAAVERRQAGVNTKPVVDVLGELEIDDPDQRADDRRVAAGAGAEADLAAERGEVDRVAPGLLGESAGKAPIRPERTRADDREPELFPVVAGRMVSERLDDEMSEGDDLERSAAGRPEPGGGARREG